MKRFYLSSAKEPHKQKVRAWEFAQRIEKTCRTMLHPYESEYWACCSSWLYLHEDWRPSDITIQDLKRADAFVMLSEGNSSYASCVEYGMALAMEMPTYIIRDPRQEFETPYFEKASLIVSEHLFLQHPFLNFYEYLELCRTSSPRTWEVASSVPVYINQARDVVIYEVLNLYNERSWRVKKVEDPHDEYVSFFSFEEAKTYLTSIVKPHEIPLPFFEDGKLPEIPKVGEISGPRAWD